MFGVFPVLGFSSGSADFSPPFGSDAARSACDGAVYMRQVGVVSCVVLRTDLKKAERLQGDPSHNSSGISKQCSVASHTPFTKV